MSNDITQEHVGPGEDFYLPEGYFWENFDPEDLPGFRERCNDLAEFARDRALGKMESGDMLYLSQSFHNLFTRLREEGSK